MPVSASFIDLVGEVFAPHGSVRHKRMFGGAGVYIDDLMVGLLADDVLYLKTDDMSVDAFDEAGLGPFVFVAKDGAETAMSYYQVPEDFFDDPDVSAHWVGMALEAALRTKAGKRKPSKRKLR